MRPSEVIGEKSHTSSLQKVQFVIEKILPSTLFCLFPLTYDCHIKTILTKQSVKVVYDL